MQGETRNTSFVAFTGHRPSKLGGYVIPNPVYDRVMKDAKERLLRIAPARAFTGMALGFDQWMGWLCTELRIPFVAVVPFDGQERMWPYKAQRNYHDLLLLADEVVVLAKEYREACLQIRNEWLVDRLDQPQDVLLACFDGTRGGTSNCLRYAHERGIANIEIIHPGHRHANG